MDKGWYCLHVSEGEEARQEARFRDMALYRRLSRLEIWIHPSWDWAKIVGTDEKGRVVTQRLMDI